MLDINVESFMGASLNQGTFDALNSDGAEFRGYFNGSESILAPAVASPVLGDWVAASVPEPSTFALSSIATIAVSGVWARRRKWD
jgi:PEP-CTERM motif